MNEETKKEILARAKGVFFNEGLMRVGGVTSDGEWTTFHVKSEDYSDETEFLAAVASIADKICGSQVEWKAII